MGTEALVLTDAQAAEVFALPVACMWAGDEGDVWVTLSAPVAGRAVNPINGRRAGCEIVEAGETLIVAATGFVYWGGSRLIAQPQPLPGVIAQGLDALSGDRFTITSDRSMDEGDAVIGWTYKDPATGVISAFGQAVQVTAHTRLGS